MKAGIRDIVICACVAASIGAAGGIALHAAETTAAASRPVAVQVEAADPRAAILEVVPPLWVQRSKDADVLWDKLIRKHATLLLEPALAREVAQRPVPEAAPLRQAEDGLAAFTKAIRVRVIPGSPLIEVSVAPDFALGDRAALIAALVETYVDKQGAAAADQVLKQMQTLTKERDRLGFRRDELTRAVLQLAQNVAVDEASTRPAEPQDRAELALGRTRLQLLRNDLEDIRKRLARIDEEAEALRAQVEAARLEVRIVRLPLR